MPDIEQTVGKEGEALENKRKRLIFRSNHRGTKEMDIIMGSFANSHVPAFSAIELQEYDELLCNNDPDLYNWLTQKEEPPEDVANMSAFQKLVQHKVT